MPQFIGASQHKFEIVDLGIESLVPLALNGWVNPSDTLVQATKNPIPKSLQGSLSVHRGQSSKGRNSKLVGAIDEMFNDAGRSCQGLK